MPRAEIWKDAKLPVQFNTKDGKKVYKTVKFAGYKISNTGKVKGMNGQLRSLQVDKNGYKTVSLRYSYKDEDGSVQRGYKLVKVHKLVACAFLDDYDPKLTVIHIKPHSRGDNRAHNLKMGTLSQAIKKFHDDKKEV